VIRPLLASLSILALAACGGPSPSERDVARPASDEPCCRAPAPPGDSPEVQVAAWAGEWDPSLGTACVKGVVKLDGRPPERRVIDMSKVDYCAKSHADKPPLEESVCVGEGGAVANVFVYVKEGLEAWKFPVPEAPALIDQSKCAYVPHVLGMQLGQTLRFRNSDPINHNVHGLPKRSPEFNIAQAKEGLENDADIRRAEVMIHVKCEVHDWMHAYVGVVKHPFFRVTGESGTFDLSGLPAGKFTIEAWHEVFGAQTQEIEVGDKETKELTIVFRGG